MVSAPSKESVRGENALYIFNRLLRMATETDLSTWKQNQVRSFMKHEQIDEILGLTDGFGRTILDNACSAGNLRLIQLVWPMGAKLGKPQVTMAMICSEHHLPIVDYLLAHDPKLATTEVMVGQEAERMPLLNFCAKKGEVQVLGILLAYAFKTQESVTESLDHAGNTPLHVAQKEKVVAQLLSRAGLDILRVSNRRGQLPIDCVLERYNNGFGYEEELKKTIAFLNTMMNTNNKPRVVSPSLSSLQRNLGGLEPLQLPIAPRTSILRRQGSSQSLTHRTPMIPSRDTKSFLSSDLLSRSVARKRALLQEERRVNLTNEIAVLQRQRMLQKELLEHEKEQTLLAMRGRNPISIMDSASLVHQQQMSSSQSSSTQSGIRHPLSPTRSTGALSPVLNSNKRYVAAIDAAFASEEVNGMSPSSLSILASALSNHKNHNVINNCNRTDKSVSMMRPMTSSGLSPSEDYRLRAAVGNSKLMYPPRFEDNELHKLLRARYC